MILAICIIIGLIAVSLVAWNLSNSSDTSKLTPDKENADNKESNTIDKEVEDGKESDAIDKDPVLVAAESADYIAITKFERFSHGNVYANFIDCEVIN